MANRIDEAREVYRAWRDTFGTSICDQVQREEGRRRLQVVGRAPRKRFTARIYQRLFDRQAGICRWCHEILEIPARRNEIDHLNPEAEDFNGETNLQLLHRACNREKSSKSMLDQAKDRNRTVTDLI